MKQFDQGQPTSRAILFILDDSEEHILIENSTKFLPFVTLPYVHVVQGSSLKGSKGSGLNGVGGSSSNSTINSNNQNDGMNNSIKSYEHLPVQNYVHKILKFDNLGVLGGGISSKLSFRMFHKF